MFATHHAHPMHGPQMLDWLRLAGFLVLALGALLALIAVVLLSQSPEGVPVIVGRSGW